MAIDHNQMAGRMFIGLGSLLTDGQVNIGSLTDSLFYLKL